MNTRSDLGIKNTATRQADDCRDYRGRFVSGNKPKTGFHTNPERRSNGHWKKSDSARYKLERMMTFTESELQILLDDEGSPTFERRIADILLNDWSWATLRDMMDQVYGKPQAPVHIDSESNEPLIKGFVIPTLPEDFIKFDKQD